MRSPQYYRYFLGFRPPPTVGEQITVEVARCGIALDAGEVERLHLTVCVIAEQVERSPFLAASVGDAIGGERLITPKVKLGRLVCSDDGVALRSIGKQDDLRGFYTRLTHLIGLRGIVPLHRKSGLNPHITLKHEGRPKRKALAPVEWFPHELLLIESWVGLRKHIVLARWPLLPPLQREFDFDADFGPQRIAA